MNNQERMRQEERIGIAVSEIDDVVRAEWSASIYPDISKTVYKTIRQVEQEAYERGRREIANEVLDAQYVVNPKTCPNGDVSQAILHPELHNQIVGTLHMSFARYMRIRDIAQPKEQE